MNKDVLLNQLKEKYGLKMWDRVMKKSGKPFPFSVGRGWLQRTKYLFTGFITRMYLTNTKDLLVDIDNGKHYIRRIAAKDLQLIDKDKINISFSAWRKVHLAENKCKDFRFSCFTGFTLHPKPKETYVNKNEAMLAAFSLQLKNSSKSYIVYKCDHCGSLHVGSEQTDEILELLENNILPLIGLS